MNHVTEDTLQVMGEIRIRMENVKHSLTDLVKVLELTPESGQEDVRQQLIELQREGLQLGVLYRWLMQG